MTSQAQDISEDEIRGYRLVSTQSRAPFKPLVKEYWKQPDKLDKGFILLDRSSMEASATDFEDPNRPLVYVRQVYRELYEDISDNQFIPPPPAERRRRGVLVTGSPGIGKSYFLVYALVRRLTEGKTTIYYTSEEKGYIFDSEGVWTINLEQLSIHDLKLEPNTNDFVWCLYDGRSDPAPTFYLHNCFLVQASSPRETRYSNWMKQALSSIKRYMDVWKPEEFREWLKLRGTPIITEEDEETFRNNLLLRGPCPRDYLLEQKVFDERVRNSVDKLVNDRTFLRLLSALESSDDSLPHRIFIVKASADRVASTLTWKTERIQEILTLQYRNCHADHVKEFYHSLNTPEVANLRGWMFEQYAIVHTSAGNSSSSGSFFRMKERITGSRVFYVSPNAKAQNSPFRVERQRDNRDFSEVTTATNNFDYTRYYVPAIRNNPLFDAVCFGDPSKRQPVVFVLQMSINATTKPAGSAKGYRLLNSIKKKVGKSVTFNYVFVVPGDEEGTNWELGNIKYQLENVKFELPPDGEDTAENWPRGDVYVQFVNI